MFEHLGVRPEMNVPAFSVFSAISELFVTERHSDQVFRASLTGHHFVWAALHHPTRWWDRLGRPYLRETVIPELTRARELALGPASAI